jgi:hypothetical protein
MIDEAIGQWTSQRTLEEILTALQSISVPAGRIYSAKDIAEDPHYRARGVIETIESAEGLKVEMPGIIPKLSQNPGEIRHRAPTLGEHTESILKEHGFTVYSNGSFYSFGNGLVWYAHRGLTSNLYCGSGIRYANPDGFRARFVCLCQLKSG